MKHLTSLLKTTALLGLTLLSTSARAADTMSWADLPKTIGIGKPVFTLDFFGESDRRDRTYTVVTTAGEKLRFPGITVYPDHISAVGRDIPAQAVSEVRIHHKGAFNDPLTQAFQGGIFMCGHMNDACEDGVVFVAMIPVSIAYGVVSTLPALAIEGIRRLLPAKVIRVTH